MKYTLYIPNRSIKERWERYARQERRPLAQFIRIAVEEKIEKMEEKDNAPLRSADRSTREI